jgi:hypothetical protein
MAHLRPNSLVDVSSLDELKLCSLEKFRRGGESSYSILDGVVDLRETRKPRAGILDA